MFGIQFSILQWHHIVNEGIAVHATTAGNITLAVQLCWLAWLKQESIACQKLFVSCLKNGSCIDNDLFVQIILERLSVTMLQRRTCSLMVKFLGDIFEYLEDWICVEGASTPKTASGISALYFLHSVFLGALQLKIKPSHPASKNVLRALSSEEKHAFLCSGSTSDRRIGTHRFIQRHQHVVYRFLHNLKSDLDCCFYNWWTENWRY